MNRIYRSLYNPVLGTWVAVSEIARSRGKRASGAAVLAVAALAAAPWGPAGAQSVLYWDLDGATAGAGGGSAPTGVWSTASATWSASDTGVAASTPWLDGSSAVFAAGSNATGSYAATLGSDVTLSGLHYRGAAPGSVLSVAPGGGNSVLLEGAAPFATVEVDADSTLLLQAPVGGAAGLRKTGDGTLTLAAGANPYAGGTRIEAGVLAISDNAQLGAAGTGLGMANGATLRLLANSIDLGRALQLDAGGGIVDVQGTQGHALVGPISGSGTLALVNSGSFDLNDASRMRLQAANTASGGTRIGREGLLSGRMGVVATGADNLGSGAVDLYLNSELLFEGNAANAGDRVLTTHESTNLKGSNSGVRFVNGASAGTARLVNQGAGSYVIFDGADTTAAGAQIDNQGGRITFYGASAGGGATLTNRLGGIVDLADAADLSGATLRNDAGTVFISNAATGIAIGSLGGDGNVVLGGKALTLGALGANDRIGGAITDAGASYADGNGSTYVDAGAASGGTLVKVGAGTLTLAGSNSYSGATTVQGGTLRIEGNHSAATGAITVLAGGTLDSGAGGLASSAITVQDQGTLAGNGNMAGAVAIAAGGRLAPGSAGPGTLRVGSLSLDAGARLDFELGQAGTPGGALNDLVEVAGNLTLAGTLNVAQPSGGSFSPGLYRLFNYGGALTNQGLAFGAVPGAPADLYLQTSVAQQVNLVNRAGLALVFWDGANPAGINNGQVDGGSGAWRAGASDERWTDADGSANAPWVNNAFAVFQGTPGVVNVDNAGGPVSFSGAQFAVDGYRVTGGPISTSSAATVVRVGDGTPAGAAFTATIDAPITGSGGLVKEDLGTLALAGANSYGGGTTLRAGTLLANHDLALGSGTLRIEGGTLGSATQATLANAIVAAGSFGVATPGGAAPRLTLAGALELAVPVTLTQATPGTVELAGAISGQALTLDAAPGAGNFLLSGSQSNSQVGATTVQGAARVDLARTGGAIAIPGDLRLDGQAQVLLHESQQIADGATVTVGSGARLAFAAAGKTETIGALLGSGAVQLAGSTLVVGAGEFGGTIADGPAPGGALEKTGPGTLALLAANSYTGPTTVQGGTLRAGVAQAFSPNSAHSVASGATLDTGGLNQGVAALHNSGTVSLLGNTAGSELRVTGAYVGQNGTLRLGTVLNASGPSDRLLLDGPAATASGQTTVQIVQRGGLGAQTTGSGIEVVAARNGASTAPAAFALAGGHVDAGAFEYQLFDGDASGAGESWYLRSQAAVDPTPPVDPTAPVTPKVPTAPGEPPPRYRAEVPLFAALPAQLRQSGQAMLGNLHRRIGDEDARVQGLQQDERRAWGRLIGADLDVRQAGTVSPHSTGHVDGLQVGTDLFALPAQAWRSGIYVGQIDGDARVSGLARDGWGPVGAADLRSQYLGAYFTYSAPEGFYADVVLQAGRHRYTLYPSGNAALSGKGDGLQASLEIGQSLRLGERWWIEPQLQLVHQNLDLADVDLAGTTVRNEADSGWLARAGLRIRGELATGLGQLQPYGRVNLYYGTSGLDKVRFITPAATTTLESGAGASSAELAAGLTLVLSPRLAVYGEIGRLFDTGGDARVQSSVQGSAGIRARW